MCIPVKVGNRREIRNYLVYYSRLTRRLNVLLLFFFLFFCLPLDLNGIAGIYGKNLLRLRKSIPLDKIEIPI